MLELVLRYLLDEAFVDRAITVMGIAGPPAGAAVGYAVGKARGRVRPDLIDGTLIGLFGTLTLVMWHVYNAIVERLELDTVRNLVVNLAVFAVVGLAVGLALRVVRPRLKAEPAPPPLPATEPPRAG